jgi:hypothetical protein
MDYKYLAEKYPEFSYENFRYSIEGKDFVAGFIFKADSEIVFRPEIRIKDVPLDRLKMIDKSVLDSFIFHLGLAEIPSYWKATCSPKIVIKCGYLDEYQLSWWKDLLIKGMGQYFFENKIDFTPSDFVTIVSTSNKKYSFAEENNLVSNLIPVGGGKDSAVTLELLKNEKRNIAFMINPTKAAIDVCGISGVREKIVEERKIDEKLLELNDKGYLNGHMPFSSVIAFNSVFAAYLFGFRNVILSNERSSDEENTEYLGREINHQYSKTLEFENKFREYAGKYLNNVNYFSFLRPIYEIQIAKIFSKMPKYFTAIRSCNVGQKTNSWCCNCAKCLSTFILLKPFIGEEKTEKMFGQNLLAKPSLEKTLSGLVDENKVKPFECVGTKRELQIALNMKASSDSPILSEWQDSNNLSDELKEILKKAILIASLP